MAQTACNHVLSNVHFTKRRLRCEVLHHPALPKSLVVQCLRQSEIYLSSPPITICSPSAAMFPSGSEPNHHRRFRATPANRSDFPVAGPRLPKGFLNREKVCPENPCEGRNTLPEYAIRRQSAPVARPALRRETAPHQQTRNRCDASNGFLRESVKIVSGMKQISLAFKSDARGNLALPHTVIK